MRITWLTSISLPSSIYFFLLGHDLSTSLIVALQILILFELCVDYLIYIINATHFCLRECVFSVILEAELLIEILQRVIYHRRLLQELVFTSISYFLYNLHVLFVLIVLIKMYFWN